MRLRSYGVAAARQRCSAYADAVAALPGVAAWIADALAEHDFLAFEEPYRSATAGASHRPT